MTHRAKVKAGTLVISLLALMTLMGVGHWRHVPIPEPVTRCRGAVEIWYKGEWVTLPITCKIPDDWAK